jgi:hypothetical protein
MSAAATAASVRSQTVQSANAGWMERAGRVGVATRGVLYAVVAWLIVDVARGRQRRTDSKGALATIAHEPLGNVLLVLIAVGLAAFTVWSFIGVVVRDGAKKLSRVGRTIIYAGLCAFATSLLIGSRSGSGSDSKESDLAARVLRLPGGRLIVAAVGIGIIVGGIANVRKAVTGRWAKSLKRQPTTPAARRVVTIVAMTGLLARAVVFALIGAFVVRAAWRYDPGQATGVDGALKRLAAAPHGPGLLVLVAVGLLAYGIWCEVIAAYGPAPGA